MCIPSLFVLLLMQPVRADIEFTALHGSEPTVDGGLSRGVAWGDFDCDGYPDLIVANTINYPELLYRNNRDGTFSQVLEVAPTLTAGWTESVSWVDIDNDGDLDIFAVRTEGRNPLYRNDGDAGFVQIEAGDLTGDNAAGSMACWADYDNDGFLDVFVVNRNEQNDTLYRNLCGVRFRRVDGIAPGSNGGDGRTCGWGDADGDGDPDLYVGNFVNRNADPPAGQRNFFYLNLGNHDFAETREHEFVTTPALTYGISWIDVDYDDDLDLFVTNIGRNDRNWLFLNDGKANFVLSKSVLVTDSTGPSKGHVWGDFDNDRDLDLYVANGTEGTPAIQNFLYLNKGNAEFKRVETGVAVNDAHVSAGVAAADFDRDGDLDLYVANWGGGDQDNDLYRNDTAGKRWLAIRLVGTRSNRMGVGARVRIDAGGWQTRWLHASNGYASQSELILHFGLGDRTTAERVEVYWPSGQIDRYEDIAGNRYWIATEATDLILENFAAQAGDSHEEEAAQ